MNRLLLTFAAADYALTLSAQGEVLFRADQGDTPSQAMTEKALAAEIKKVSKKLALSEDQQTEVARLYTNANNQLKELDKQRTQGGGRMGGMMGGMMPGGMPGAGAARPQGAPAQGGQAAARPQGAATPGAGAAAGTQGAAAGAARPQSAAAAGAQPGQGMPGGMMPGAGAARQQGAAAGAQAGQAAAGAQGAAADAARPQGAAAGAQAGQAAAGAARPQGMPGGMGGMMGGRFGGMQSPKARIEEERDNAVKAILDEKQLKKYERYLKVKAANSGGGMGMGMAF
ncbi:MAG: hypothetical protein IKI72_05615 [Bacteroidales bacterium]|nr:hypothetical protein [Bacteroidales bacterium]